MTVHDFAWFFMTFNDFLKWFSIICHDVSWFLIELSGFQGWVRLTWRGAAEDINREPLGSLNEYFPHLESSERHLGAAREISEISWGSLQQLLGIFGRPFSESWGSLGDFKAAPGCLLVAFGCLGGETCPDFEVTKC